MKIEELLKNIPRKLNILEEHFNLNQTQMAEKAGMSRTLYSTIRRGAQTPSIDFILKICITFDISLDWLVFNEGQMFKPDKKFLSELDPVKISILKNIESFNEKTQLNFYKHIESALELIIKNKED
jgi:transcriptional regulator with XRE-family HTH domain